MSEQSFPKEASTYVVKRPAVCRAMQYTGPDSLSAIVEFIAQYDMLDSKIVQIDDAGVTIPTGNWDSLTASSVVVTAKQGDYIVIRPALYSPYEADFFSMVKVEILSEHDFNDTYQKESA